MKKRFRKLAHGIAFLYSSLVVLILLSLSLITFAGIATIITGILSAF